MAKQAEQRFFKFYDDYSQNYLRFMTGDQVKTLMMALVNFHLYGELPDFEEDPLLSMAFAVISGNIARDKEKYIETCERNKRNRNKKRDAIREHFDDGVADLLVEDNEE